VIRHILAHMAGADPGANSSPEARTFDVMAGPRLELDQLLLQLVERAQDVMSAQNRLRGLYAANNAIIGDLDLPVVLRRIVEEACRLVNARYGALGVLAPSGTGLEQFIHVGIDDDLADEIGELPAGKGLLGALIDDPRPVRLHDLGDDYRSVGFPAHHPPMTSFLGVPIRVRDEVFGNLYLTEAADGDFTADDEEVVTALAATAGVVIENARLFAQSRRRQDWLRASMLVTRQLLSSVGEEPLALIARQVRQIADADVVSVVLPTPDRKHLMVEVASGDGSADLLGHTLPIEHTMTGQTFETGEPLLVEDASTNDKYTVHLNDVMPMGPVMALPLVGSSEVRGALLIGRRQGRHLFDDADLDMARNFANQAAVALELADARADQQRMILLEDRDRIARDLHDHVIQRLFATGLGLQGLAAGLRDSGQAERLERAVADIDDTIRQIRTSIFQLRGALGPRLSSARSRVTEVVAAVTPLLGFEPRLDFAGPVDALVPDDVVEDLVAVTREALTNVARHAGAQAAEVSLSVEGDELALCVADDGTGIADTERRSGLANLARRAERRGGGFAVDDNPTTGTDRRGTRLTWTIPLS